MYSKCIVFSVFLKQLSILNIPPTTEVKVLFTFRCDATIVTVLQTSLSEHVYEVCSNPIIISAGGGGLTVGIYAAIQKTIHAHDRILIFKLPVCIILLLTLRAHAQRGL